MRIKNILLATDLSEASARCYPYAAALARAAGAQITVLYADEYEPPEAHQAGSIKALLTHINEARDQLLEEATVRLTGWDLPATLERVPGRASEVIVAEAERINADIVVVATHGERGLTRLFAGSTCRRLLRTCARPVLVVPALADPELNEIPSFDNVLATTDLGADSERGLAVAVTVARKLRANLDVVTAIDLPTILLTLTGTAKFRISPAWREQTERSAQAELQGGLDELGIKAHAIARVGNPDETILGVALERKSDLVVIPSHGKGRLRAALGSTSEAVIDQARVPVLVLPRAWLVATRDVLSPDRP
jgi:nucleotide-binding universal stress UspA family protein